MTKKTLPLKYLALILIAFGLLVFTAVTGTLAEPNIQSDVQTSNMEMKQIGVSLQKKNNSSEDFTSIAKIEYNGSWVTDVSDLFANTTAGAGKTIPVQLRVYNNGNIGEFVRVTVYKYWVDENGKKRFDLDPGFIQIDKNGISENWLVDSESDEKTVMYYNTMLSPEQASEIFMNGISIDGKIKNEYEKTVDEYKEGNKTYTRTTYSYAYDGKQFKINVEVDAVQDHHAEDAIKSSWGKKVTINEIKDADGNVIAKTLSLS